MISLIIRFSSISEPCVVPSQNLGFENLVYDKYTTLFVYRHCSLGVALVFVSDLKAVLTFIHNYLQNIHIAQGFKNLGLKE